MMTIRFDWKFWLILAITLAGVLVPVWLWRADLEARSLHFRTLSQTSLQPPDTAKALDLKISVGESELKSPYLTVFELVNDGTRPVPSSDFESSIEINTTQADIIRVSITGVKPSDLSPSLVIDAGKLKIEPMLLNPGDSVTFAVLTINEQPSFLSKARISGVQSVPIINAQNKSKSSLGIALAILAGILSLIAANLVIDGWPTRGIKLRPRSSFVVFAVAAIGATIYLSAGLEGLGIKGLIPFIVTFAVLMVLTSLISIWLNRPGSDERVSKQKT